jgi:hypothetical protein
LALIKKAGNVTGIPTISKTRLGIREYRVINGSFVKIAVIAVFAAICHNLCKFGNLYCYLYIKNGKLLQIVQIVVNCANCRKTAKLPQERQLLLHHSTHS